jgi:hypothetical protein
MDEKNSNEARYGQLSLAVKSVEPRDNEDFQVSTVRKPFVANVPAYKQVPFDNELESHCLLIQTLLHEIDACRSNLEQARHLRIRNGLVNVHSTEALLFQHTHGPQTDQIFGHISRGTGAEIACSGCIGKAETSKTVRPSLEGICLVV